MDPSTIERTRYTIRTERRGQVLMTVGPAAGLTEATVQAVAAELTEVYGPLSISATVVI